MCSRPWRQRCPSLRSNAHLSVALRDRPAMRGPEKRDRSAIARVLPVALSYVASGLAEPRPRIRESASLYIASTLSRTLRIAPRDLGLKTCSYSFLTQGKIACENILTARICTAVRTGAKRGTHFVVHRPTGCISPIR